MSVNVLIAGATGFIGSRLAAAFSRAGHRVTGAGRAAAAPPGIACAAWLPLDYHAPDVESWTRALSGIDVVVNAVGILREREPGDFQKLHSDGPRALFAAAKAAGVRRIVQISALGAEDGAVARYHRSKHQADRYLLDLDVDGVVLQPSLVYGAGGGSATLFDTLATLPVIVLPGSGDPRVQPVHVDDLIDALLHVCTAPTDERVLAVVGPVPLSLRDFLRELRAALGLAPTWTWPMPRPFIVLGARLGDLLPGLMLDSETLGMLERGNTGSPAALTRTLGREPRPVSQFIEAPERAGRALLARWQWLDPLLRLSIAAMWIWAAVVSLWLYPTAQSLALLREVGVPAGLATPALYGAAALDFLLGVLTLWPRMPRWLWTAQIALVLGYTAILSWHIPALWFEPFGPLVKNLPILALLLLMQLAGSRR